MDNIIKKIAGKLEINEEIVEKAVRSQFKFVVETMQEGEYESVHLHYFGKFAVKPGVLHYLAEKKAGYLRKRELKKLLEEDGE